MTSSDKKWNVVPPDEMRCVWMTAGILSYQLCDRKFECDSCPLDAGIRNHPPRTTASRDENGNRRVSFTDQQNLRDDRLYSRNHCWTKRTNGNLVQVGIEPGLSEALLAPKAIVFPSAGQRIHRGQTCLWIVMEGGTYPVESPLDGIVRSTNHLLSNSPHLLSRQPLDKGWLLELEAEAPAVEEAALMSKEQADSVYGPDQDRFLAYLENAASGSHPSVGVTLADGGQRLQNIADMLGPTKYFALLRKAFC
jgi:glycine cleavage system H lipoate-binding protein